MTQNRAAKRPAMILYSVFFFPQQTDALERKKKRNTLVKSTAIIAQLDTSLQPLWPVEPGKNVPVKRGGP